MFQKHFLKTKSHIPGLVTPWACRRRPKTVSPVSEAPLPLLQALPSSDQCQSKPFGQFVLSHAVTGQVLVILADREKGDWARAATSAVAADWRRIAPAGNCCSAATFWRPPIPSAMVRGLIGKEYRRHLQRWPWGFDSQVVKGTLESVL